MRAVVRASLGTRATVDGSACDMGLGAMSSASLGFCTTKVSVSIGDMFCVFGHMS